MSSLILLARQGDALFLSPLDQPAVRTPSLPAAIVDIYMGYVDEPFGKATLVGQITPGNTLIVPFNPERDRDVRFYKIVRSAEGIPDVSQMLDADTQVLEVNRVTEAPDVTQATNATNTTVVLSLPASRFVRTVRVETSPNADYSGSTITEYTVDDTGSGLTGAVPSSILIARPPGPLAHTIYYRVSVSGGVGDTARFTPPVDGSITFATIGGSGGSGGTGYPPGAIMPVTVS